MNHELPFDLDAEFQALNQELDAQTSARIAELQNEIDHLRGKLKSVQDAQEQAEKINGRKKLQELFSMAQDLELDAVRSLVFLGTYLPQDCLELLAEKALEYWGYPNEYQAQMGRETGLRNNPLGIVAQLLKEQAPIPHLDTVLLEQEENSLWWR